MLNIPIAESSDPFDPFFKVAAVLKSTGCVSYIEIMTNAKVPIIKCDHFPTGISVDICMNNTSGIETGIYIFVSVYMYIYIISVIYV